MAEIKKLHLELCKGCIEDLDLYNPYVHEDGTPVSRDQMVITEVDYAECMNSEQNLVVKNGIWK